MDRAIGPHNYNFTSLRGKRQSRLNPDAAQRVVVGLDHAATAIRAALQAEWGDKHLPIGLKDRLNALKWLRSADYAKYRKVAKH